MESKELKLLIFSINDEYYATDIMEVERILGYEDPTEIPDCPDFVEGVINYEGSILPIISLAKRFNLPEQQIKNDSKIIVAKQSESRIGIIVDVVSEVKDISEDCIEDPPEVILGISKRYIKGLVKNDKQIIIFLNLSAILTDDEKRML